MRAKLALPPFDNVRVIQGILVFRIPGLVNLLLEDPGKLME
jgi:hypothetical protein